MLYGTDGLLPSISLISQVQCRRSTHDIIHHDHSARPLGMMPWIIDFGSQRHTTVRLGPFQAILRSSGSNRTTVLQSSCWHCNALLATELF